MRNPISTLTIPLLALILPSTVNSQAAPGGGAPVAIPTVATQDATVRMVNSLFTLNGATSVSQILFTQTFASTALGTWELGPTPRQGTIGLGSIEGTVGGTKETAKAGRRWVDGLGAVPVPTAWGW